MLALLYKRMSKERWKGNPPTPYNLSVYRLRLAPSNHSSCSDIPPEYPTMILHTANRTLITSTMPQHLTSQHLSPLPYHNKLYRHHLLTFSSHFCIHQHLHLSVTTIPSAHPIRLISTLYPITRNPSRDNAVSNTPCGQSLTRSGCRWWKQ